MNIIKTALLLILFICANLTVNSSETSQNTTDTNSIKMQYIETEPKAKAIDSVSTDTVAAAIDTPNELTWWDKYAEPAIVVFAAAISTLLLFGARSK